MYMEIKFIFSNTKILFLVILLFMVVGIIALPSFCSAKYTVDQATSFVDTMNKGVGAEQADYTTIIAKVVQAGLGVVGLVFFMLVFYGGYMWLVARGKEEDIKKAQDTIIAAVIGLVIIVGSYALTNFVFSRLVGGSAAGAPSSGMTGKDTNQTPTGTLGCCIDEAKTSDSIWNIGSDLGLTTHWLWSITDDKNCALQGNTCNESDAICGSKNGEHWAFTPGITDMEKCEELAKIRENG